MFIKQKDENTRDSDWKYRSRAEISVEYKPIIEKESILIGLTPIVISLYLAIYLTLGRENEETRFCCFNFCDIKALFLRTRFCRL